MNKQDRNTAFTIGVVLLICVIALVAVGSSLWSAISPGVESGLNVLGVFVSRSTATYNFDVPGQGIEIVDNTVDTDTDTSNSEVQVDSEVIEEEPVALQATIDQNFFVDPFVNKKEYDPSHFYKQDKIIIDILDAGYFATEYNELDLKIKIDKLGVDSRIYSDLPARFALQNGFVIHPSSKKLTEGEVIFNCYRAYQLPTSNASCYYIDSLSRGDEIRLINNGSEINYEVKGVTSISVESRNIYAAEGGAEYLRIVAVDLREPFQHRIVVLAKRIND